MILNGLNFIQALELCASIIPEVGHDLKWCQEKRKKAHQNDMVGIGRVALHIPDPVFPILKAYHPELFEGEPDDYEKAWKKFIFHPDSEPFRLGNKL